MRGLPLCASILLAGCIVHRGAGWEQAPRAAETGAVSLVVLGEAGAPGRDAARVAGELARALANERAAGRRPVVLWLGDAMLPERERVRRPRCPDTRTAWSHEGVRDLAVVVRRHVEAGGASFGLPGELAHRCGHTGAAPPREQPFVQPGMHAVVRVGSGGAASVAATCTPESCTRAVVSDEAALVDLVLVDLVPHLRPRHVGPVSREAHARALDRLLELLAHTAGPPRILVSQAPVEAANEHGLGGIDPVATWHNLPPPLRAALRDGTFVGAIGALDRASDVEGDLGPAVARSDKAFVAAPLWQVVSGAASRPNARAGAAGRRSRFARGLAYVPDLASDHLGFAIVRVGPTRTDAVLRVRKGRRWTTGSVALPTRAEPKPREVATVPMQPCLRCDEVPASERR